MCTPESAHPLQQSVWAVVLGWVLQQGEGARNGGQQLAARMLVQRTIDSTHHFSNLFAIHISYI